MMTITYPHVGERGKGRKKMGRRERRETNVKQMG